MNNGLASLCFVSFAMFSQVLTAKENLIIEATEDDYIGDVPRVLIGISTALRTPNYLEGNSNLKPERIISREIGYLGNFGKLNLDAKVFYDNIHDFNKSDIDSTIPLLAITPSGYALIKQPKVYANAGDVAVKGFEAQAKWHIAKDTNFLLNYAYVNINADEKQTANNNTMSMPHNTNSAFITHRFNSQWYKVMPIIKPVKLPLWEMVV